MLSRSNQRSVVITPNRGWSFDDLREAFENRELLYFLVWRDVKVRYKQSVLGVAWAVIQPLFLMLVFTLFFGSLIGVPSEGIPYAVFTYTALLPWNLFARGLTDASTSLTNNQSLITKVYFPRIMLPTAAVLAAALDFLVAFVVLIGLMLFYGIVPTWAVVALPLFIVLAIVASMSVGFWFSALDAKYRDVRYALPFLTQFWMFLTPVVYPLSIVPEAWRWLYSLNPMVGVVEGFRWALLGQSTPLDPTAYLSVGVTALLFVGGLAYFHHSEQTFADVV